LGSYPGRSLDAGVVGCVFGNGAEVVKLAYTFLTWFLCEIYLVIGFNVKNIWGDQPDMHITVQTMAYAFGAGAFFVIGLMSMVSWIKENK
jgi:hypothetical protein